MSEPDSVAPKILATDGAQFAGRVPLAGRGQMFYWFVSALATDPLAAPIIVVLEGGPGMSDGYQMFAGCGPYRLNDDGHSRQNEHTWASFASLLFIDQPLGVGFSTLDSAYAGPMTSSVNAEQIYAAMQRIFSLHPALTPDRTAGRPLFIFGHSYAGRLAPALAHRWIAEQGATDLGGLILGNPEADLATQMPALPDYLWQNGVISQSRYHALRAEIAKLVNQTASDVDVSSIGPNYLSMHDEVPYRLQNQFNLWCTAHAIAPSACQQLFIPWMYPRLERMLNATAIKTALHVPATAQYLPVNPQAAARLHADEAASSTPDVEFVLQAGVSVLVYNGADDGMLPIAGVRQWLYSLDFARKAAFSVAKPAFWGLQSPNGQYAVFGNVITDGVSLTSVAVYAGGHFANFDVPLQTAEAVRAWVTNRIVGLRQVDELPSFTPAQSLPSGGMYSAGEMGGMFVGAFVAGTLCALLGYLAWRSSLCLRNRQNDTAGDTRLAIVEMDAARDGHTEPEPTKP